MKLLLTLLMILSTLAFADLHDTLTKNSAKQVAHPIVVLETTQGTIEIELRPDYAPLAVENFTTHVKNGYYNGLIFHRIIKDFMIQGGGFNEQMIQKSPNAPIKNEANNGLSNIRGSIAMARTNDPHSATAQFFINTVDNSFLDFSSEQGSGWGYAVFGQVIEGMDTVDTIRAVATSNKGGHGDVPNDSVIIIKATIVQ